MTVSDTTPWRARITALASDREQGAAAIARQAATALAEGAEGGAPAKPLLAALIELIHGQRSMAPLLRLAADLSSELRGGKLGHFQEIAEGWAESIENARQEFLDQLEHRFHSGDRWAVFSYSSTVLEGMQFLRDSGIEGSVLVAESRPGGEGTQTARQLAAQGWDVTLVADTHLYNRVRSAELDRLVLGCDAVGSKRFINKIGSGALASLARREGVDCEIWTTTHKLVPPAALDLLRVDEAQAGELRPPGEDIRIEQPLFGFGRLEDINLLRTERGVMNVQEVGEFIEKLPALDTGMLELDPANNSGDTD
jgi:translation initiation factor 2B subunit (eIF-2B alpha/beta/delta family)